MEKSVYEKISKIWEKCKKGTCPDLPSVYYAKNENNDIYYVAKDSSTVVFLVYMYENKPYTYVILKKYLTISEEEGMKHYFIEKPGKLGLVSCSNNQVNEFDTFIVEKIISKIKTK